MRNPRLINFQIDYLRCYVPNSKDFEESIERGIIDGYFSGLSENSDLKDVVFFGQSFSVEYKFVRGLAILEFRRGIIRVFEINMAHDIGFGNKQFLTFVFYGAFFQYEWAMKTLEQFSRAFDVFAKITRVDLALDLDCSTSVIYKGGLKSRYNEDKFDFYKLNPKTKRFQTWYIGNKNVSKNKKHFIRVYDKREELLTKSQLKLAEFEKYRCYIDKFKWVSRVEAQINSMSCEGYKINFRNLFDEDFLKSVFSSIIINPHGAILNTLKDIFVQEYAIKSITKTKTEEITDLLPYIKTFNGYMNKLDDYGFDIKKHVSNFLKIKRSKK